jgi:hypothetical protein
LWKNNRKEINKALKEEESRSSMGVTPKWTVRPNSNTSTLMSKVFSHFPEQPVTPVCAFKGLCLYLSHHIIVSGVRLQGPQKPSLLNLFLTLANKLGNWWTGATQTAGGVISWLAEQQRQGLGQLLSSEFRIIASWSR